MRNYIYDILERGGDDVRHIALAMKVCAGIATDDLQKLKRGAARRLKPQEPAPVNRECGWCGFVATVRSDHPMMAKWLWENPGVPVVANELSDFCSADCQNAHKKALGVVLREARHRLIRMKPGTEG